MVLNKKKFKQKYLRGILGAAFAVVLFAAPVFSADYENSPNDQSLEFQKGDKMQIDVYREDDLTGIYEVDALGSIHFPLIGKIKVEGSDTSEVTEKLTVELAEYLRVPQVRVNREETDTQKKATTKTVTINGYVRTPGVYDYVPGMSLMRIVSLSGGFIRSANKKEVRIIAAGKGNQNAQVEEVNASDIEKGKSPDPILKPGDMVFVPESMF